MIRKSLHLAFYGLIACGSTIVAEEAVLPTIFQQEEQTDVTSPAYLEQFVGVFDTALGPFELKMEDNHLMALLGSYGSYELAPEKPLHFVVKGFDDLAIRFVKDDAGKVNEVVVNYAGTEYTFQKQS